MVFLSPRNLMSLGNVAFSLLLGVAALVLTFAFFPSFTLSLMRGAAGLKERVVSVTGNPQYEIIARTVLHESSILLMGFTLVARIALSLLASIIGKVTSRG